MRKWPPTFQPFLPLITANRRARLPKGYSLVELLVVAAIISLMTGLGASSLTGNHSANLNTGGNLVVDLAIQARQNSITKNTMTALVMDTCGRHFILMEHTDTDWTAITRWNVLPQNVKVDTTSSDSSFSTQKPAVTLSNLPFCSGSNVSADTCSYQIFLPDGRLSVYGISTPMAPSLRLVEANTPGNNYYDISLNYLTGIAKVNRP
ncbi:MAG: Tfp pilus assembly protein FimT/FimU [Chthoniobacteraceae bacterium]